MIMVVMACVMIVSMIVMMGDWDYSGADDVTAGDDNGGDSQTADGLIFSWVGKIIDI